VVHSGNLAKRATEASCGECAALCNRSIGAGAFVKRPAFQKRLDSNLLLAKSWPFLIGDPSGRILRESAGCVTI